MSFNNVSHNGSTNLYTSHIHQYLLSLAFSKCSYCNEVTCHWGFDLHFSDK